MLKETIIHYLALYTYVDASSKEFNPIFYYSVTQIVIAVLFAIVIGVFIKYRHKLSHTWFIVAIVGLLVADLGRNAVNYIDPYYYKIRYSDNTLYDYLRNHPGRVTFKENPMPGSRFLDNQDHNWNMMVNEWTGYEFPYYEIETLDATQMPRVMTLDKTYFTFFNNGIDPRFWQLTGTKYALAPYGQFTNIDYTLGRGKLSTVFRFDIDERYKPQIKSNGQYALMEVENSLNRFELYNRYYTITNEQLSLNILGANVFNPKIRVVIDTPVKFAPGSPPTNKLGIDIIKYQPNRISLNVSAATNSILLFNNHYDPNWRVTIDGKKTETVRANYIMMGIPIATGDHKVKLEYRVPKWPLLLTLGGIVGITGAVLWLSRKENSKI